MSKTSSVVKDRYNKKTYDQINLRVPKGQKEQIQQIASNTNMSVNEFYRNALDKYIDSIGSEKL
jgi:predicted HicB family RNase H-like nuclease